MLGLWVGTPRWNVDTQAFYKAITSIDKINVELLLYFVLLCNRMKDVAFSFDARSAFLGSNIVAFPRIILSSDARVVIVLQTRDSKR